MNRSAARWRTDLIKQVLGRRGVTKRSRSQYPADVSSVADKPKGRVQSSRKRRPPGPEGVARFWPLLLGAVIAIFIKRIAAMIVIVAPELARFVLPLPYLVKGHAFGLPVTTESISEFAMYAQFPIYGLLLIAFWRRLRLDFAFLWLVAVHCVLFLMAAFVLHT